MSYIDVKFDIVITTHKRNSYSQVEILALRLSSIILLVNVKMNYDVILVLFLGKIMILIMVIITILIIIIMTVIIIIHSYYNYGS